MGTGTQIFEWRILGWKPVSTGGKGGVLWGSEISELGICPWTYI